MCWDIRRREIYSAMLDPVVGSEQGGIRPVLVLQNNIGNRHSPTTVGAAITSRPKKISQPTHFIVPEDCGLEVPSIVMLEQIRTIDTSRILYHIGRIGYKAMREVNRRLAVSLGIEL